MGKKKDDPMYIDRLFIQPLQDGRRPIKGAFKRVDTFLTKNPLGRQVNRQIKKKGK